MSKKKFLIIGFSIAVGLILFDQLTKFIVEKNVLYDSQITIIPNILYITKVYNTGATGSMLGNNAYTVIFLLILSVLGTVLLSLFLVKRDYTRSKISNLAVILMLGGCVGNLIDRFIYVFNLRSLPYTTPFDINNFNPDAINGGVIDFIMHPFFFGVYNFADMCLVVGVFLFAFYVIFLDEKAKKKTEEATDESN